MTIYVIRANAFWFICHVTALIVSCILWLSFPYGPGLICIYIILAAHLGLKLSRERSKELPDFKHTNIDSNEHVRSIHLMVICGSFSSILIIPFVSSQMRIISEIPSDIKRFFLILLPAVAYYLSEVYRYFIFAFERNYNTKGTVPVREIQTLLCLFVFLYLGIMTFLILGVSEFLSVLNTCLKWTAPVSESDRILGKELPSWPFCLYILLCIVITFSGIVTEVKKAFQRNR